jgi:hypothetical protein
MKTLLFIFLFASPCFALDLDTDKEKHLYVSAAIGALADSAIYHGVPYISPSGRIVTASVIAIIPGILKEVSDENFDTQDLVADAEGVAIGVLLSEVVNRSFFVSLSDKHAAAGIQWEW